MFKIPCELLFSIVDQLLKEGRITLLQQRQIKEVFLDRQKRDNPVQMVSYTMPEGIITPTPGSLSHLEENWLVNIACSVHEIGVSDEVFGELMFTAYQRSLAVIVDRSSVSLTETLRFAIMKKNHSLAHYLLDNKLCLKEDVPDKKLYTCLQAILFPEYYDESLFTKILAQEKFLNHSDEHGVTALYLAADNDNLPAFSAILGRQNIRIEGRMITTSLFRLICEKPVFLRVLKEKVQDESYVLPQDCRSLGFPIVWLSGKNRALLKQQVTAVMADMPLFCDNEKLRRDFDEFLNDPSPLPFKQADRISIAWDCLDYLQRPETINQYNTSLCGSACCLQHLILSDPVRFIYMVMELCELRTKKPKILPQKIQSIPENVLNSSFRLSSIWLETIRYAYNKVFYYDASSVLERFSGVLTPDQLVHMYSDFGFQTSSETCQIRFISSNRFGSFFDEARKVLSRYCSLPRPLKIYSAHHLELQHADHRFKALCEATEKSKYLTVLIKIEMLFKTLGYSHETTGIMRFMEDSHYILISEFRFSEVVQEVSFKFMTYGAEYSATLAADVFKEYYLGSVLVEYQQPLMIQQESKGAGL